jgi:2-polyprenyl-3-methyl-5-hydroxy-6-metoxy-1,4-benzoquinol methylase
MTPSALTDPSLLGSAQRPSLSACPVCGGCAQPKATAFDDRYGYPGRFQVFECEACGHLALDAGLPAAEVERLYTTFYPRSTFDADAWQPAAPASRWTAWWQGLHASAFRWVPANVRVLDIGCGFGEALGYHRARGCDAHGVEADANILRVAQRHGLQVRVGLFEPAAYAPSSFDVVTLDQVIEHVADPLSVLRGVEQVLKPGGMAVLSTPNARGWGARLFGRRWIHWHAPYHQQFFTTESMQSAARAAGLQVESMRTVTNSAWLRFQWCHLAAPTREGERSTFWNPSLPRSTWQGALFRLAALADRLGLNAALTRLFDLLGAGDNRVFVLRKPAP